jgi:DNA segregation ATPase FtsK/SpoIIIE-like protein
MNRGYDDALAMDGFDADDESVAMPDDSDDDGYDYSYRQQRTDGRPLPGESGNPSMSLHSGSSRAADDTDAIDEEIFHQATHCILVHRKASVSLLQRKLKIGFARAGRVMDMLEERGIVGPNVGSKVREILVDPDEYLAQVDGESGHRF